MTISTLIVLIFMVAAATVPPLLLASKTAPRLTAQLIAGARRTVRLFFWIACAAGLLIAIAQLGAVVTRNIFGVNFIKLQESATYLFAAMFLLPTGAILLADGHVRVDVLYGRWSAKRQRLIDLIGLYAFVLPVALLVVFAAAPYVTSSWANWERSGDPSGIHAVFLLKSLIPLFGVLLAMAIGVRATDLLTGRHDALDDGSHGHVG